jgi:hypothetical protein
MFDAVIALLFIKMKKPRLGLFFSIKHFNYGDKNLIIINLYELTFFDNLCK